MSGAATMLRVTAVAVEASLPFPNGLGKEETKQLPMPGRDVPAGERWTFAEHRSMAEVIAAEIARAA